MLIEIRSWQGAEKKVENPWHGVWLVGCCFVVSPQHFFDEQKRSFFHPFLSLVVYPGFINVYPIHNGLYTFEVVQPTKFLPVETAGIVGSWP